VTRLRLIRIVAPSGARLIWLKTLPGRYVQDETIPKHGGRAQMDPLFTTNELVAFTSIAVILGLLAGAVAYSWRVAAGALTVGGAPRFHDVVRRLGIELAAADERTLRAAAVSVRRCLTCRHEQACDAWLADRSRKGVPPNCPNEQFFRERS
jgi:hypothetical protein